MPQYDFRCKSCGQVFSIRYRSYAEYDSAAPSCLECGSLDLARLISHVSIGGMQRDYSKMSSSEMLSVFEAGDERQVKDLFRQVGGADKVSGGRAQGGSGKAAGLPEKDAPQRFTDTNRARHRAPRR